MSWTVRYSAHFTASPHIVRRQDATGEYKSSKQREKWREDSALRLGVCHELFAIDRTNSPCFFPSPVFPWGPRLCTARSETLTFRHFPLLPYDPPQDHRQQLSFFFLSSISVRLRYRTLCNTFSNVKDNFPCLRVNVYEQRDPWCGPVEPEKGYFTVEIRDPDHRFSPCPRLYYPIGLLLPCQLFILYLVVLLARTNRCDR